MMITFPRVISVMLVLIALALLHAVGVRHDFSRLAPISQAKSTAAVNGVPVYQSVSDQVSDVHSSLPYRLAPLSELADSPTATLSPFAGRSLLQSAALTPQASSSALASAR
jgi:hypothetical protein